MSGSKGLEHGAVRLRKQVAQALVLRRFCRWCGPWWFVWGGMVLALRSAWGDVGWPLLGGIAALPTLLLLAVLRERENVPTLAQARAIVDDRAQAGGLLMAAGEGLRADIWLADQETTSPPMLHWRARRMLILQLCGLLFLVLAFLVPAPKFRTPESEAPFLDLKAMLTDYEAQIEVLEEEKLLSPQDEAELAAMAKRLTEQTAAQNPELAWEALDSLGSALDDRSREAAQKALEKMVGAEQAKKIMDQLAKAAEEGKLTPDQVAEAAKLMAKHMAANPAAQELAAEVAEAAKNGGLDAAGLQKLAKAAEAMGKQPARQLGRLADEGMIEGGQAGLAEALAKQRGKAKADLAEFLAKQGLGDGLQDMLGQDGMNQMGDGWDVNEGPGHAALTWTEGSSEEGVKFIDETLTGKRPEDLSESRQIGTDVVAPKTVDGPVATQSGALSGAKASGGSARTHRILPSHRRAVSSFFSRSNPSGDTGK
jgi:hypothetical protein